MRIGIHVAWAKQEAAYMAGQLADLANSLGHTVSILSTQPVSGPVYAGWDEHVLSHRTDFASWAKRQKTVIWFDCEPEKVKQVQTLGGRNVLVMLWHRLSAHDLPTLGMFNGVVCPSRSSLSHLLQYNQNLPLSQVDWDTLTQFAYPQSIEGLTRVFVPLEAQTARKVGPLIMHALQIVAECRQDIQFTIGQCQHWSRAAMQAVTEASRSLPKRFVVTKRTTWQSWLGLLDETDWVFNPSISENAMLTNVAAMYKRIPVSAFDMPPVDELIRNHVNGSLISCDLADNFWWIPVAQPTPKKLVDSLVDVLGDPELTKRLTAITHSNRLHRRRVAFERFWEAELEKTDRWA